MIFNGCKDENLVGSNQQDFFDTANNINFNLVEKGSYGSIANTNAVIRDSSQFKKFWRTLHADLYPIPAIPQIDFDKQMVIASTMATKPTGGFSVLIKKAGVFNDTLGIAVTNTRPVKQCGTTTALTTPFLIIKMEDIEKPVRFFKTKVTNECSE